MVQYIRPSKKAEYYISGAGTLERYGPAQFLRGGLPISVDEGSRENIVPRHVNGEEGSEEELLEFSLAEIVLMNDELGSNQSCVIVHVACWDGILVPTANIRGLIGQEEQLLDEEGVTKPVMEANMLYDRLRIQRTMGGFFQCGGDEEGLPPEQLKDDDQWGEARRGNWVNQARDFLSDPRSLKWLEE